MSVSLFFLKAPLALVPVAAFLATLLHFDSYKLVSIREVTYTLVAGAAMAAICYFANDWAMDFAGFDFRDFMRYVAPVLEEIMKSSILVYLFVRNRIGFKIDAAIMGFSVGTGFAFVENLYLLYAFPDASLGTWIIRGFGTAVMHAGTTALSGITAQFLIERRGKLNVLYFLPGLAAAIAFHAMFNFLEATPLLATVLIVLTLPPGFLLLFTKSERGVHTWLVSDYESHQHLLDEIRSGRFEDSEAGQFIVRLHDRFGSDTVSKIFLYVQIHTELVLRAESMTLARETEVDVITDPADRERLMKLHHLEREIGHTALIALKPHLHFSRRELWEINELSGEIAGVEKS
jgi:RsiW-degrading membrane proteinase PrsW (M82 family)